MRSVSSKPRSLNYGEISWEDRDPSETSEGKKSLQEFVTKSNFVPLIKILKYYNVKLDSQHMATCPFKFHQNGKESSSSFKYYETTNSFYCFGCKKGNQYAHACEFVSLMDESSRFDAAQKIITYFSDDLDPELEQSVSYIDYNDQTIILLQLSNIIRNFRQDYPDPESLFFIEQRCEMFDKLNIKYELDEQSLKLLVQFIVEQINLFIRN